MINVCYAIRPKNLDKNCLDKVINSLPKSVVKEANEFTDEKRKLNFLTGRLILREMLKEEFVHIGRSDFGKPYLEGGRHFNISHSDSLVVCAISDNQRLGVDSERVRKINLQDYESVLNEDDHYIIQNSNDKMRAFYRIWTQKESLTKADGRGVFIDMKDIFLRNMQGHIKGETGRWRLISFTIIEDYEISLCHEWGKEDVKLRRLDEVWEQFA